MTVVDRILKEYLPELMSHGAHIIASVPIYNYAASPAFYRLTSMAFRTYSEANITPRNEAQGSSSRPEQILFVLGMTANGILPNLRSFKPSARWVVHASAGFSHGTLAISRSTFHLRLHSLLARVNALTTLVPVSPSYDGMAGGRDIVQQWAKHKDFSSQSCDWKAVDSDDNLTADKFEWQYTREWNMSEEGTRLAVKGNYFVSCEFEMIRRCLLRMSFNERLQALLTMSWNCQTSRCFPADRLKSECQGRSSCASRVRGRITPGGPCSRVFCGVV